MAPNDDDRVCTFSGNLRGLRLFHRPRHQIKPTKTVCCQSPVARTMADHSIHADEQHQNFCCQNCSGTMHILLDANQGRQQPLLETRTQLNSGIHYHSRALHHIQPAISVSVAAILAALLVQSHLDYANSLLNGALAAYLHKLQCSQNALFRTVIRHQDCLSAHSQLINLHWLPVRKKMNIRLLCSLIKSWLQTSLLTTDFIRTWIAALKG